MRVKFILSVLTFAITVVTATNAATISYPNVGTVAPVESFKAISSGDLVGYFYSSSAAYDNQIGVFVNGAQLGGYALDNHLSTYGQSVNFGHVNAGDSVVFVLNVLTQGYKLYSNVALNSDLTNHIYATAFGGETNGGATIPTGLLVGFEDQAMSIADLDYNDEIAVFTNVAVNPEPVSFVLFGTGLLALGLFRRKRA